MIVRIEKIGNEGLLGIKKITNNREDLLQKLSENQQKEALSQISDMRSEKRVVEWLSTRVLIAELLEKDVSIFNTDNGRPYLSDESCNISISHTKGYVAILLSKKYRVGIDIESISDRIYRIKERFVSDKEFIDPNHSLIHLLLHWSAKETMFKLLHEEQVDFKDHLFVHPFTPAQKGLFEISESKTKLCKTLHVNYEILKDAVLTWAIDR